MGMPAADTCDRSGCKARALYQIGITVYGVGRGAHDSDPLVAAIGLYVCEEHMADTQVDDVVSEQLWDILRRTTAAIGRVPPNRATASLTFTPLGAPV